MADLLAWPPGPCPPTPRYVLLAVFAYGRKRKLQSNTMKNHFRSSEIFQQKLLEVFFSQHRTPHVDEKVCCFFFLGDVGTFVLIIGEEEGADKLLLLKL